MNNPKHTEVIYFDPSLSEHILEASFIRSSIIYLKITKVKDEAYNDKTILILT